MKKYLLSLLFVVTLFGLGTAQTQVPSPMPASFKGCKPEGNAKGTKAKPDGKLSASKENLNLWKNRDTAPKLLDQTITLERIMKPSEDKKFTNNEGAAIIGYVAEVKAGEPKETCNCARDDLSDIHIDVVLKQSDAEKNSRYMIVEITPRWQKELGDLDTLKAAIEHKWVKFTGWMFYDSVHKANAKNTNPKGKAVWRATAWEIHPVTEFTVVPAPQ